MSRNAVEPEETKNKLNAFFTINTEIENVMTFLS